MRRASRVGLLEEWLVRVRESLLLREAERDDAAERDDRVVDALEALLERAALGRAARSEAPAGRDTGGEGEVSRF